MQELDRLAPEGIAVSRVTVAEVYEGAFGEDDPPLYLKKYRDFLKPFRKLGLNDRIVLRFARIRSDLRKRGLIISDFDILLGATALEHGLTVLTNNRKHFERIAGLSMLSAQRRGSNQ